MGSSFSKQCFEIHSDIRLPFEPKGEALALREEIRRNVRSFRPCEYNHLSASLISNEKSFFDAENVLFYNVGSAAFSHLQLDEISFSLESDPMCSNNKYTYHYELTSKVAAEVTQNTIIEFCFDINELLSDMKPLDYWLAFTQGDIITSQLIDPQEFGLSIVFDIPKKHRNITSLIKPLIDGLIASFHYQSSVDQRVLDYISKKTHISEYDVMSKLRHKEHSFLGERKLISSYREGIKWNPADEKCTRVNLKQVIGSSPKIKVHGKVYSIKRSV
jgi:hypothetical protein